eukprot:scaffold133743_cov18-Tisochrysis_lutea.AAC.1
MSAFHLRLVCKRKMQWLPASKILFNTLKARNACLQSVQILGLLGTICAAFVKEVHSQAHACIFPWMNFRQCQFRVHVPHSCMGESEC